MPMTQPTPTELANLILISPYEAYVRAMEEIKAEDKEEAYEDNDLNGFESEESCRSYSRSTFNSWKA